MNAIRMGTSGGCFMADHCGRLLTLRLCCKSGTVIIDAVELSNPSIRSLRILLPPEFGGCSWSQSDGPPHLQGRIFSGTILHLNVSLVSVWSCFLTLQYLSSIFTLTLVGDHNFQLPILFPDVDVYFTTCGGKYRDDRLNGVMAWAELSL